MISTKLWGSDRIPASSSDHIQRDVDSMNFRSSVAVTAMLAAHPTAAQDHRFEADPVVSVHEKSMRTDLVLSPEGVQ
jgi:hypothetical protein